MNKYDIAVKCSAVVASCETPEQMACAWRFINIARRQVYLSRQFSAIDDLQRLVHETCPQTHELDGKFFWNMGNFISKKKHLRSGRSQMPTITPPRKP